MFWLDPGGHRFTRLTGNYISATLSRKSAIADALEKIQEIQNEEELLINSVVYSTVLSIEKQGVTNNQNGT